MRYPAPSLRRLVSCVDCTDIRMKSMTGLPPAKRLLGLILDGDWEVIEERPLWILFRQRQRGRLRPCARAMISTPRVANSAIWPAPGVFRAFGIAQSRNGFTTRTLP